MLRRWRWLAGWALLGPLGLAAQPTLPVELASYGFPFELYRQIGLDWLHARGYTGRGVRIAVFDSGFLGVNANPAFDRLRSEGRLMVAYDVFASEPDVFADDVHGAYVLGQLAAWLPGSYVGGAPDATYLLFRTENVGSETRAEELAWGLALDSAIARGAHVVVSALTYTTFDPGQGDYTPTQMDGQTAVITQAARRAAPAGIVVVNSAGNEGLTAWRSIGAPCDAPELLCIGAVDAFGAAPGFSSYGPSADGRVKPDVVARGVAVPLIGPGGGIIASSGTSYAAPLVAALVACLRQAHPWATAEQVIAAVRASTSTFPSADAQRGYGLPSAQRADAHLRALRGDAPLSGPQLVLYPNPASGAVAARLEHSPQLTDVRLELLDLTGRVLRVVSNAASDRDVRIELGGISPGLYLVRATWAGGSTSGRLLVTL